MLTSSNGLYRMESTNTSNSFLQNSSRNNIRFEVIMEAPTAAAQKIDETPLTYLNKGQSYNITLKDTHQFEGYITSTIMIMFHDENHRKVAPNYWKFWQTQQNNPHMARAIDVELSRSNGLHQVECHYFDRITFRWYGNKGANLLIKFNCLSTDFSRIKGVKGIPLRLHMESNINDDYIEKTYCRIKLFRDKGAERKNKDDAKHIERQLEKLRGKHGEPHPLWLTYSHAVPYTLFQEIDTKDVSTLYQTTTNSSRSVSSSRQSPSSYSIPSPPIPLAPPSPSITSHHSRHPQQQFKTSPSKRHHRYLTDPGYPLPSHPNLFQQHTPPLPITLAPHHPSTAAAAASSISPWITSPSVDIDPDYIPQKRHRVAKLSIFVRFENQSVYRAIYLEELTVQHLKEKILMKMEFEDEDQKTLIRDMVRQVPTKQDLLVTMDDDAIIQDIPEEQVILINKRINDDGSITLILIY
ncbi:CP2 transcription factor-domain-containing protein [Halteromyces radiatus]|uniref:CP2 transcription factor-domain-containing protein n=1 Tax=Halteromyces radiatus TaxID=101107 RepID=UPI00221F95B3|nr:CP2 transcription factor-domain-containing protein [Halteromyces radiatus]KAI8093727.1 CP2 transcription factor-domain-containing protein [Halteromyces radiatus]